MAYNAPQKKEKSLRPFVDAHVPKISARALSRSAPRFTWIPRSTPGSSPYPTWLACAYRNIEVRRAITIIRINEGCIERERERKRGRGRERDRVRVRGWEGGRGRGEEGKREKGGATIGRFAARFVRVCLHVLERALSSLLTPRPPHPDARPTLPRARSSRPACALPPPAPRAARGVHCPAVRQSAWFPPGTRASFALGHCSPFPGSLVSNIATSESERAGASERTSRRAPTLLHGTCRISRGMTTTHQIASSPRSDPASPRVCVVLRNRGTLAKSTPAKLADMRPFLEKDRICICVCVRTKSLTYTHAS
jgi:hypothetical protein